MMQARYQLQSELASGGMGKVYRAQDSALEREVALKTILPDLAEDPHYRQRFLAEARAAASLEHPNIVPIHDLGTDSDDHPYIAMKLIQGRDLGVVIDQLDNQDADTAKEHSFVRRVEIVKAIGDALHYAHQRGLVHRDIKPANILLGDHGEVYLTDWGVVKGQEKLPDLSFAEAVQQACPSLTSAGQIVGTLDYMAPELLSGAQADARCDVYSLGATMYHLFALRRPYHGRESISELLTAIMHEDPPPAETELRKHQGRVPRHLALIIEKAMARQPERRHQTCAELTRELQDYLDGEAPSVCVCTWTDNRLSGLSRRLNDYPKSFIVLATILLTLPLIELMMIVALW